MNHDEHLAKIAALLGQPITSWEFLEQGFDNFAYGINEDWVFKIPRQEDIWTMLQDEKRFLDVFHSQSPVPVPYFEYFGDHVVGYRKIHGSSLRAKTLASLSPSEQKQLAQDMGAFLRALHSTPYESLSGTAYRKFFTPEGYEKLKAEILKTILPLCSTATQANIKNFFAEFEQDERNFQNKQVILHNDLYDSHILLDSQNKLCGIIDFGEIGTGAQVKDLLMIANFCDPKNDSFLNELIKSYGPEDTDLHRKVKTFARLELLYWPTEDLRDAQKDPRKKADFDRDMERVELFFS